MLWCEWNCLSWVDCPYQGNGSGELLGSPERKWGVAGEWYDIWWSTIERARRLHLCYIQNLATSELQKLSTLDDNPLLNGPRREKTCLRGFRQSEFQTSPLSYSDQLEKWNFTCSKLTYASFQKANNIGADQTVQMRRLVCACVVCKPQMTGFLTSRPKCEYNS